MKRRSFLSTAGTIGVVGTVSTASLANSAYTSLSTQASLAEFSKLHHSALTSFTANIQENLQGHELAHNLSSQIALPVRILKKESKAISYKNKAGQNVSLGFKNGLAQVRITNA